MSRFYRLSIIEVNVLEVIVELPGRLLEGKPADVLGQRLNEAAADAVRQKWRAIHPNTPYPLVMPEHFQVEPLADFDPNTVGLGFGPFETEIGARAYITKAPSGLVF